MLNYGHILNMSKNYMLSYWMQQTNIITDEMQKKILNKTYCLASSPT